MAEENKAKQKALDDLALAYKLNQSGFLANPDMSPGLVLETYAAIVIADREIDKRILEKGAHEK